MIVYMVDFSIVRKLPPSFNSKKDAVILKCPDSFTSSFASYKNPNCFVMPLLEIIEN